MPGTRVGTKTGKLRPNVKPSDKAVKKIKAKLTELTKRELTGYPTRMIQRQPIWEQI